MLIGQSTFAQSEDDLEVYLAFTHRGVINSYIVAYYNNDQFYLPINEIYNLLEIDVETDGLTVSGNFSTSQTPYLIDFERNIISFGTENYSFTADDFLITEFDLYLQPEIYEQVFGLRFNVDLNNLMLNLDTDKEIPAVEKQLRAQRRRLADTNRLGESYYPLQEDLKRQIIDGGFLDYSISALTTSDQNTFSYNSSLGLELFGGDVQGSFFGSASKTVSSFQTDNFRWRYIIRESPYISNIIVGQTALDGVIASPYTGIRITNDPIEPRKYFDEFEVEGNTLPQSEIELYLNNTLIDFQQANELGDYRFLTPIYYGRSQLDLKIYGPTGQLIERTSRIQIPFTLLPTGEINYNINVGQLDYALVGSLEKSMALQANTSVGISKWLTAKVGVEYYDQGLENDSPVFTSRLSSRLFSKYIVSLEGVSNNYYRASMNAIFPSSASINLDYLDYVSESPIYNSSGNDKQLLASYFQPFKLLGKSLNIRASSFSRYRDDDIYSTVRLDLNARFRKLNLKLGYNDRLINTLNPLNSSETAYIESSATYSISRDRNLPQFIRGTFLRFQSIYIPSESSLKSLEALVSRNILSSGRFQIAVGRNFVSDYTSFRFNLIVDFKKVRTNSTVSIVKDSFTSTQNIRGSIGYDSNFGNLLFTSRDQVGRSGTAVRLYIDNNSNQYFDTGDSIIPDGNLRVSRSGASTTHKNGIVYITQMQSYYRYNMEMNKGSIPNPMLVPDVDKFSIITNPNSFKKIDLPFYMSGVIDGVVERLNADSSITGIGGLKLILDSEKREIHKEIRTYSDGSFYDYELPPGEYTLQVDQSQLDLLNVTSHPAVIDFEVEAIAEGDFIEGLYFTLKSNNLPQDSTQLEQQQITIAQVTDEIKSSPEILEFSEETFLQLDESLRLIIKAQNAFYSKNLDLAFRYVNQSLELFETAQAYALKGSFYYFEGNREQAQREWQMALRFNPDLYIPNMEILEERVTTSSSE